MSFIINSFLDQDIYKLTTGQMFFNEFRTYDAIYKFKCRSGEDLTKFAQTIASEIKHLGDLQFAEEDIRWLDRTKKFSFYYLQFLKDFKLYPDEEIAVSVIDGVLDIRILGDVEITKGSMYEVFVLAIVQEVYGRDIEFGREEPINFDAARYKTLNKCAKIIASGISVVEFGTRRRHSHAWQDQVIGIMSRAGAIKGTSNMFFARKYNIPCIGTMPHEYLQAFQAKRGVRLKEFQKVALKTWLDFYGSDETMRTALTDVVGMNAFLCDMFDFKEILTGFRHDSGDPFEWVDSLIEFFEVRGYPKEFVMSLLAIFSDGLDVDLSIKLAKYCENRIKCSFGIGTNLTNDLGYKPLQIVMKMVLCDGLPVAKISDSSGKGMCESAAFETYLREIFS